MYLFGGTNSTDLFHKNSGFEDVYSFDLRSFTWTSIRTFGIAPKGLSYIYLAKINEKNLLIFWADFNKNNLEMQASRFNTDTHEWEEQDCRTKKPDYRYGSSCLFDEKKNICLIFGGFGWNKNESNAISNEIDRYVILREKDKRLLKNVELYNDEKLNIDQLNVKQRSFEKEEPIKNLDYNEDLEEDEELTFEELLEREKKLQEEEEKNKPDSKKTKKKKAKKKNTNQKK